MRAWSRIWAAAALILVVNALPAQRAEAAGLTSPPPFPAVVEETPDVASTQAIEDLYETAAPEGLPEAVPAQPAEEPNEPQDSPPPAAPFDQSMDSGLLSLVNQSHPIPADYVPERVGLSGKVPVTNSGIALRPEVAEAYLKLYQDMVDQGIRNCYALSGYRSYWTQESLVNRRVQERVGRGMVWQEAYADTIAGTAPAGTSEHQTGLAIDFSAGNGLNQAFADSAPGAWLREHAWEYGFTLRYQEEKRDLTLIMNEPWHYRYLGVPHAQILQDNNWCLEEYVEYLHTNGSYSITTGGTTYDIYWTDDTSRGFEQILDLSSDNAGGWIVTTVRPADPLSKVFGSRSEPAFAALRSAGVSFPPETDPDTLITRGQFANLCGLAGPAAPDELPTREGAALLMNERFTDRSLTYLEYQDTAQISGAAFQSVQLAVSNHMFLHKAGMFFHPQGIMTWGEVAELLVALLESA